MKKTLIKADWAALTIALNGSVILSLLDNCYHFDSTEEVKQAIARKEIVVKKWALAAPRNLCILKSVPLPASDLAEAAKMVEFELPSLIPLTSDEITYSCMLRERHENTLDVLVCILKLLSLEQYLQPFDLVNIEPHAVILEWLAFHHWFMTSYTCALDNKILVLLNDHKYLVMSSSHGNFYGAKELVLKNKDIETACHEVATEILQQAGRIPGSGTVEQAVLIAGSDEYVGHLKNIVSNSNYKNFTSENCLLVSTPQISPYPENDNSKTFNNYQYESIVAKGLSNLCQTSELSVLNMVPHSQLRKFQKKTAFYNYLSTGLMVLLSVVLLCSSLWLLNRRIELKSSKILAAIAPIKDIASAVDSKRQHVRAMENQVSSRGLVTDMFEEFYTYTPKDISISYLRFTWRENQPYIEIKGQASELANALGYPEAMSKSKLLEKIQVIDAQQVPRPGGSIVEFKARCFLQSE